MYIQALVRGHLYSYRYYIGLAAAISIVWQQVYYQVFRIPKELRHIPAITYSQQILALLRREPITLRTQKMVFPLLPAANGIYINKMPFLWTVFIANPVLAKTVLFKPELADKHSILGAFPESSAFYKFVGKDNIAFTNGEQWKKQRKIMNPIFHRALPIGMFGSMVPKLFRIINETQAKGENVIVVKLMKRLTLDVLGKAVFGFDFGGLDRERSIWANTCDRAFESFLDFVSIFPRVDAMLRFLSQSHRDQYNATFKLIGLLDDMIEKRRVALLDTKETSSKGVPDHEKDLLTLMLEAKMRGEGNWGEDELRHNIAVFLFAGHDTTATTLSFALYNLASDKKAQTKARKEVVDLLGDESKDISPTLDQCKRMPYIDMIIKETLRMYSPANDIFARVASEDLELGGIMIPKGAKVSIDIHALHYHPDLWKDPERFIPERFAESGEYSMHEGISWMPFSGGSRQCLGMNFSIMEQRITLAMLLRKYEWELPAGSIHQNGVVLDQPFSFAPASLELKFKQLY